MPVTPKTTLQQKLARANAWLHADVEALFKEESATDALNFVVGVVETRDLVGSTKAYKNLEPLLEYLLDHPKIDIEPLVPLLRQLCGFEGYNPGGTRQYEVVRNHSMRLLARRKDPAARALIDRFIAAFPEKPGDTWSVSMIEIMARAAFDLGAREVLPALQALLDTMLLAYSPKQRKAELASAVDALAALAKVKVKGAGPAAKPAAKLTKGVRGVALVEAAIEQAKADGRAGKPVAGKTIAKLTMPDGSPIPASLAAWLAFDGDELDVVKRGALAWKPFAKVMRETFGTDIVPMVKLFERFFPHPCLLLPGGSDSRRFLYAGAADSTGEYPVFVIDIDDVPWVGLCFPGFDVYIAAESGLPIKLSGYSADWKGPYGEALTEHARLNFQGKREHELSAADLDA